MSLNKIHINDVYRVSASSKCLPMLYAALEDETRYYDLRVSKASRGVVNIRLEVRQADTDHFAEILNACTGGGCN